MWDPIIVFIQLVASGLFIFGFLWGAATLSASGASYELRAKGQKRMFSSAGGFLVVLLAPSIYSLIFQILDGNS